MLCNASTYLQQLCDIIYSSRIKIVVSFVSNVHCFVLHDNMSTISILVSGVHHKARV